MLGYSHSCDEAGLATRLFFLAAFATIVASVVLAAWLGGAAGGSPDRCVAVAFALGLLLMLPYLYTVLQVLPTYDPCD